MPSTRKTPTMMSNILVDMTAILATPLLMTCAVSTLPEGFKFAHLRLDEYPAQQ